MPRKDSVRDYFALAVHVTVLYHRPLLERFHDDLIQELHLIAWEAQIKKRITVRSRGKRHNYGNGRRMGRRSFCRAVHARLYRFQKRYY